jgi:hypothetical protein
MAEKSLATLQYCSFAAITAMIRHNGTVRRHALKLKKAEFLIPLTDLLIAMEIMVGH